jgi:hypothetical protein
MRVLWDLGVGGGLTCGFWAVFGGGWGIYFWVARRGFGAWRGAGAVGFCPRPMHDDEAVLHGAPGLLGPGSSAGAEPTRPQERVRMGHPAVGCYETLIGDEQE